MRGLHWFRNDLRLLDNLPLMALAERVDEWLPVFVLDPELLGRDPSTRPRTRFLLEGVARLAEDLARRGVALQLLEGRPEREIPRFARATNAAVVSFATAPTPQGARRDERVEAALARAGISVVAMRDHTVFGPDEILTRKGTHHSIYTPYRNAWWEAWQAGPRLAASRVRMPRDPIAPARGRKAVVRSAEVALARLERLARTRASDRAPELPRAGEAAARRRLADFLGKDVGRYASDRDRPDRDGTSRLSPHLRFGTVSVRTCFTKALAAAEASPGDRPGIRKWLDELVWREFYHGILARDPRILTRNLRSEFDGLVWSTDASAFEAWRCGRTGYPFVDAGMRQLAATGWMHNRVRMVVASFLVKHLLIDWRRGARHFFEALVDGDPASNSGGWQWAASTGTDAQPYFRIFNPVAQGERWDPEGSYVRRWVPELRGLPVDRIHAPWRKGEMPSGYPRPIVDHEFARARALAAFRSARQGSSRARTRSSR